MVFRLTTDDEGGARLVNQNRIDLVHNSVIKATLNAISGLVDHVVSQVIKAEFVIGAVGDIRLISSLFIFALHVRKVDANRQTQKVVKLSHPLRITIGQVIIYRHDMNTLARQGVEIHRQRRSERFTLARSHF